MDRIFALQKSFVEDKQNTDGALIRHIIHRYRMKYCDRYVIVEDAKQDIPKKQYERIVPVGSLEYTQMFLEKEFGEKATMTPIEIPEPIIPFVKRPYVIKRGSEITEEEKDAGKYFVKDIDHLKKWNSLLYDGNISRFIEPNTNYSISKKIDFLSEWRLFILNGEITGAENYIGNPVLFPGSDIIKSMIRWYTVSGSAPGAYTLDIGITKTKFDEYITEPIEVHPFVSCGLYGFEEEELLEMLDLGYEWYREENMRRLQEKI